MKKFLSATLSFFYDRSSCPQSLNWANSGVPQLYQATYSICVRREEGYCKVCGLLIFVLFPGHFSKKCLALFVKLASLTIQLKTCNVHRFAGNPQLIQIRSKPTQRFRLPQLSTGHIKAVLIVLEKVSSELQS